MINQISQVRLTQVHPKLAALVNQMDLALTMEGIQIEVVQGLRTMAEQATIFAQGRTTPGKIVTEARPGYSMHNFGVAVDLVPGIRGQASWEPNWVAESPDFATMVKCGIGLGLVSGSEWKSFPDMPHFQLAGLPVTPTDPMRECLESKGVEGFWEEYLADLADLA